VSYLLGDSSGPALEFNYLAFLREIVDSAVVLLEAEGTLTANATRRDARANESAGLIRAVEELGKDAAALVEPVAKEQPKAPVGRCAAAIAKAIKEAVAAEITQAKAEASTATDQIAGEDSQVRVKARAALEKLLKAHDLPGAEQELEATWGGGTVKATLRQRAKFGVEAVIALEVAGSALLVPDLRVDRIAEGVEVHVREAGGLLKKRDKLVTQRLGRHQVASVTVTDKHTAVQLREGAGTITVTATKSGEITIDGGAGKEYEVEERDRTGLNLLASKLEGAVRDLEDHRTGIGEINIDGKPFAEYPHPRVLAERLVSAIAPTVQAIARHSRSPGELVLRRELADNRREEVYIKISDIVSRIDSLPVSARAVFGPLSLGGSSIPPPAASTPVAAPPAAAAPPMRPKSPTPMDEKKLGAAIDAALDAEEKA
jgi:hypothetical protein